MKTRFWTSCAVIAFAGMAAIVAAQEPIAAAVDPGCSSDGMCATGGCCQMVTEKVPIKKVVYSTKCVPVCELHPGCRGDCGPNCKLYYKNVLVKKEIVVGYKCVTKCVVPKTE